MTSVAVIGDGQMGLVLAMLLQEKGLSPTLWGPFPGELAALKDTRQSPRFKGFSLPRGVRVEPDEARALKGVDVALAAIPCQFIRAVWQRVGPHVPPSAIIVSVAKGVEERTLQTPLQVIGECIKAVSRGDAEATASSRDRLACVSGPTIAAELAQRRPATVVAASQPADAARAVQDLLTVPWLRVYTHDDVIGVELAGATKNVIAIAAGIVDGLGLGFNAKSALLARGLAEIARLGVACGARAETFFGIAGVGDLATTCFCPDSRNRTCGERLGRGESLQAILSSTNSVVEGVATTRSVKALAAREGVDMPITLAVHDILFEGLQPRQAIALLMERESKAETIG